ncbi:unnamed protein product [Prorocentrum cordatum]|nr:unnamed protein product [Polarella glacialis]
MESRRLPKGGVNSRSIQPTTLAGYLGALGMQAGTVDDAQLVTFSVDAAGGLCVDASGLGAVLVVLARAVVQQESRLEELEAPGAGRGSEGDPDGNFAPFVDFDDDEPYFRNCGAEYRDPINHYEGPDIAKSSTYWVEPKEVLVSGPMKFFAKDIHGFTFHVEDDVRAEDHMILAVLWSDFFKHCADAYDVPLGRMGLAPRARAADVVPYSIHGAH